MGMLGGLLSVVSVPSASADPGDPFSPTEPTVFVGQGDDQTQLLQATANATSGEWEFDEEGAPRLFRYNAMGFNEADNYLYAVVENDTGTGAFPDRTVVRIGQDGVPENTGFTLPDGSMPWSGAFNKDDGLYHVSTANGSRTWVIDVSTPTPTLDEDRTTDAGEIVFDYAYVDGYFWGLNGDGIKRIDPATGDSDFFPAPASWDLAPGDYGAAWVFGNGNLGFSNNAGGVYQISVENPGAATPDFSLVGSQPGPGSTRNDGAAIPGLPTDLSVTKDGPARLMPGGSISYDVTVTNNGPGVSSGWVVRDVLPDGLSNPEVTGDVAPPQMIDGALVVSGGRLAVDEERTFTITADVAGDVDQCITNAAEVLSNEEDPEPGNNIDDTETCQPELAITKTSDASEDTRVGDTVTYTVTATNTGTVDYTDDAPATVFDDLSGVLDDATYHNDASANQPGELGYSEPHLSWSGALAVDESVEITYTATLDQAGDKTARNVAWEPEDPEEPPESPECDPPDDGIDPDTGEPCAEEEYPLPQLEITKSADQTELPAAGEQVEYTITVTNTGPGDYTVDAPAVVTDDLSGVLDAEATYHDDAASTVGDAPTYEEPTLTWSGPLESDATAEITYTVTYDGGGDLNLRNLACIEEETEVAPGTPECAFVEVPGAGLTQWKQVSASETPAVEGSVLTYTLFFHNDGEVAADVDAVDNLVHVLDDAEVTSEPTSPDGLTADLTGDEIAITGSVPAGETYSVTYQVTVLPDGERGDDTAANFLLPPEEEPPPEPVCEPEDGEFPDCTETPIDPPPADPPQDEGLPSTGAAFSLAGILAGLLILGAGGFLVWRSRRGTTT